MTAQPSAPAQAETTILRLRRHGRVLTLPVLVLIAVAGLSGFYIGTFPEAWMNWVAAGGALLTALLLGVLPVLSWLSSRSIITNRRVIVRYGLLVHRRSEVPLSRVREVRSKRGPVQRMYGSGDVDLLVGADTVTRLRDVPGPVGVVDALQELIEQNYQAGALGQAGYAQPGAPLGPGSPAVHGATTVLPR